VLFFVWGQRTHDRFLSLYFFLLVFSYVVFFFSLYFICYLLVIMLWPRWFDWIPFDLDLCVVDVYVTLAFGSIRKNGPDFYVVDECIAWLNCRGE
jgi:CHASE2 domain-containing sensor protein